jgi:hypothetical protein
MISADVSKTLESLKKAHAEIVRRMENMVRGFAYEFVLTAISNTPLGDYEQYKKLYDSRTYLKPEPGFAQGSWQVDYQPPLQEQDVYSGEEALRNVKSRMSYYELGQSFTIGNTGPYIAVLESGTGSKKAPSGITGPTVDQVMNAYKINLVRYYKQ